MLIVSFHDQDHQYQKQNKLVNILKIITNSLDVDQGVLFFDHYIAAPPNFTNNISGTYFGGYLDCCIFKIFVKMKAQILIFIFACIFLQINNLSITHTANYNTCFYLPIGDISTSKNFNYTITQAWTAEQQAQLKSGALNTSNFIDVKGWRPYTTRNTFFAVVAVKGVNVLKQLNFVKNVLKGQDAPEFYLSTSDLEFAFGSPSKAKLYTVPSGKALITLRFQASVDSNPYVGRWSVIIDLVDSDEIELVLKATVSRIRRQAKSQNLTPQQVTSVLNIIPPFIENSIFWTLPSSPAQGTTAPVEYQGFVEVIRTGESILAGPIEDGQPRVIQVKDLVKDRSLCQ